MVSADNSSDLSSIQTTCKLSFHGAAANSCPHSLIWVRAPSSSSSSHDGDGGAVDVVSDCDNERLADTVVYASSGVINLATSYGCISKNNVTSVDSTLVTRTLDHSKENTTKKVLARGEAVEDAAAARSVTALAWVSNENKNNEDYVSAKMFGMVASFSDGTVTSWRYNKGCWAEHVLIGHDPKHQSPTDATCERFFEDDMNKTNLQESIADVSATNVDHQSGTSWLVATASSKGIFLHMSNVTDKEETVHSRQIGHHAAASVQLQSRRSNNDEEMKECYMFAGSASPRHNKVWVYTIPYHSNGVGNNVASSWVSLPLVTIGEPHYHGHLMGHQDWITCFSWLDNFISGESKGGREESLLASSGHDAKIRLWKFSSWSSTSTVIKEDNVPELEGQSEGSDVGSDIDEDEANIDDLEEEEGEARLIINHVGTSSACATTTTTAVSLEALLLGHEEPVTSLTWRKQTPQNEDKPCLLSSSMDRTILLWMEEEYTNESSAGVGTGNGSGRVWVPISRVGSAGGILGGSIGASLMGFVDATFSPDDANPRIVGHGYGGSVHFWTQALPEKLTMEAEEGNGGENEEEDAMVTARWVADPCITGHFRCVEDMSWDPNGEYLLTTSLDQTTRLWTEVPIKNSNHCRWVEVGRPQVHGYDMTSIVCIGGGSTKSGVNGESGEPCHRIVSGADEKMLRVFDAPASTLRTLQSIKQSRTSIIPDASPEDESDVGNQTSSWRVERAFLPSLGLSNKATADQDLESSKFSGPVNDDDFAAKLDTAEDRDVELKMPSERDLGVTTLWPETRKLFGHESELVCLDAYRAPPGVNEATLVASSCKARNDVASAAIRLWDAKKGKCVGILKGGHRSTVSTMSFSTDGKYLASSGKDRRICIWKRSNESIGVPDEGPGYELCGAADSAHKRIVWSVHFCPNRSDILVSGSRDGLIKIWRILEEGDGSIEIAEISRFEPSLKTGKNPITAVAFAGDILKCNRGCSNIDFGILGIGTESGCIEVWAVPIPPKTMNLGIEEVTPNPILLWAIPPDDCHFDTVKKISWRPTSLSTMDELEEEGSVHLTLATCGQDNGVRIFELVIKK